MEHMVSAIYFSPTGGTRGYVRAVAAALCTDFDECDLTPQEGRRAEHTFAADDWVVVGVPVYYGRVAPVAGLLDGLRGNGTPAVLVAVYGNRAVEDALVELSDLCVARGFVPVAAGAFVAPHSFSEKIGAGRPDADDLRAAAELGDKAREKLLGGDASPVVLPGNRPYRAFQVVPFYPKGDRKCTACGQCAKLCPVGAISADSPAKTDGACCIRCMACVRQCPAHSRGIHNPVFGAVVKKLEMDLTRTAQAPTLYC